MTIKGVENLSESEKLMLINSQILINSASEIKSVSEFEIINRVSMLNTAIEILMHFVVSTLNLNVDVNAGFRKLRTTLHKQMNNKTIPSFPLSELDPVNNARNNGLHRGIAPKATYLQNWITTSKEFYNYITRVVCGRSVEFTMLSLVSQDYWKEKFQEIEEHYESKNFEEFCSDCTNLLYAIQGFLITMDLHNIIYNKYALDGDQFVNYEQSTFRFNALNFGIRFTEFKKLQLSCSLLSTALSAYEEDSETEIDDFVKEQFSIESIQIEADKIYMKIWDYLVRTGIANINPFEKGMQVEISVDEDKILTNLIPIVVTKPKTIQLYVGYLRDVNFIHNLEKKSIHLDWKGFGKTTTPIPITKVEYLLMSSRDFMMFILESDKWDYLRPKPKKEKSNDS